MSYTINYTWYELGFFFFVYSFLGWALEVLVRALRTGRLCDPTPLSGPWCPSYGVGAVVVIVALDPLSGNIPAQLVGCFVLGNLVEFFSGTVVGWLAGHRLDQFRQNRMSGSRSGWVYTLAWGGLAVLALYFFQPFVYLSCKLLPSMAVRVLVVALWVLLGCDAAAMAYVLQRTKRRSALAEGISDRLEQTSDRWGGRLFRALQRRLYRAFPELEAAPPVPGTGFGKPQEGRRFAQGLCLNKLLWVFFIGCLLGDWIETLYV